MRSDGQDGDITPDGAVIPEDAKGGGSCLFGIGLKDILASRPFKAVIFVGLKSGMPRVCLQKTQGLAYGLEPLGQTLVFFEFLQIMPGFVSE